MLDSNKLDIFSYEYLLTYTTEFEIDSSYTQLIFGAFESEV